MVKKSSKIHYRFQGQMRSCKDIFQSCKHRRGRSRYLLSVPVEICGEGGTAPISAKLVFVRNRSNRKNYLVLLSTDTSLTEDEVIQLYGKRWDTHLSHDLSPEGSAIILKTKMTAVAQHRSGSEFHTKILKSHGFCV